MSRRQSRPEGLPIIHARAAGIDIGSRFHVVAVAPGLSDQPVQTFPPSWCSRKTSTILRMDNLMFAMWSLANLPRVPRLSRALRNYK